MESTRIGKYGAFLAPSTRCPCFPTQGCVFHLLEPILTMAAALTVQSPFTRLGDGEGEEAARWGGGAEVSQQERDGIGSSQAGRGSRKTGGSAPACPSTLVMHAQFPSTVRHLRSPNDSRAWLGKCWVSVLVVTEQENQTDIRCLPSLTASAASRRLTRSGPARTLARCLLTCVSPGVYESHSTFLSPFSASVLCRHSSHTCTHRVSYIEP